MVLLVMVLELVVDLQEFDLVELVLVPVVGELVLVPVVGELVLVPVVEEQVVNKMFVKYFFLVRFE